MTIGHKTGGRTKGTPNKKTLALQAKVEAAGRVSPLDYVLGVMWDADAPPAMRFEAAKAALPFLHPKLAAIEHSGPEGGPIETRDLSVIERRRRCAVYVMKLGGMGRWPEGRR
jgi:hypothetical protein